MRFRKEHSKYDSYKTGLLEWFTSAKLLFSSVSEIHVLTTQQWNLTEVDQIDDCLWKRRKRFYAQNYF